MVSKPRCDVWVHFDNIVEEGIAVCKLCKQSLKNDRSYSLRKHMRRLHSSGNQVWQYFDNIANEGFATCKICCQRVRNNRIYNMIYHMKRIHDFNIEDETVKEKRSHPGSDENDEMSESSPIYKRSRRSLNIEMEEETIVRAAIGLMIDDGVAPKLFDSKNMKALLGPMCEAISKQENKEFVVNEAENERILCVVANRIRNDFSNELHFRLLSLKIDTDINASPNTFCISALFINEGHMHTRALGIIDLGDEKQLLENHIKDVLHKFNIDSNQIVSAFWDTSKANFYHPVKNSEYLKEIENLESFPDISLGDIKIELYMGVMGQLCVLDIFRNSEIFKLFMECRKLVKFINDESNGYYEIFEKKNLKIPQMDSPWKWGSSYAMIFDLKESRYLLQYTKYEKLDYPEDHFTLNDSLWSFMEAFCKSVHVMQKTILKYYSEELNIGDFYAQWLKCKLLTEQLVHESTKKNNHEALVSSELLKCIEKRSKVLLGQGQFTACLYLDPRFQHTLNLQQKTNASKYLKDLWSRAKIYNADFLDSGLLSRGQSKTAQMFEDDEDAFLNEFLSQDVQVKDTRTADVYNKIDTFKLSFQVVDTNILSLWQLLKSREPEMHALSEICFAIPATQIYSQMRYSQTTCQNEINSKVSTFTKGNLLLMRLNSNLIDDAIKQLELFKDEKLSNEEPTERNTTATNVASTVKIMIASNTETSYVPSKIIALSYD